MPPLPKIPKKTVRTAPYVQKIPQMVRQRTLLDKASTIANIGKDSEYIINYNNMNKIKDEIKTALLNKAFYSDDKKYIKDAMSLIGENKITPELEKRIDTITLGTGVLRVDNSRKSLAYFYNKYGDFDKMRNGVFVSNIDNYPSIILRYQTQAHDIEDSHSIIINITKDFHISFFRNYSDIKIPDDVNIYGSRNTRLHLTSNDKDRLYLTGSELEFILESDKLVGLFNRIIHYITNMSSFKDNAPLDSTHKTFFSNISDKRTVVENLEKLKALFNSKQTGGSINKNLQKIEKLKNNIKLLKLKIKINKEAINNLMRKNKEAKASKKYKK
jgi:hypothetical protein